MKDDKAAACDPTKEIVIGIHNALVGTLDMLGMQTLGKIINENKNEDRYVAWGISLCHKQKSCMCNLLKDEKNRGCDLVKEFIWENKSSSELMDLMELHGMIEVTTPSLIEVMRMFVNRNNGAHESCLHTEDCFESDKRYLEMYCECCNEQTVFVNEFLKWQLRFGSTSNLVSGSPSHDGT